MTRLNDTITRQECSEKCREAFAQLRHDVSFMEVPRTVNQMRHAVLRMIDLAVWHEGWGDEDASTSGLPGEGSS